MQYLYIVVLSSLVTALSAQAFDINVVNGDQHVINGNWHAALEAYNNALDQAPDNVGILVKRANLYNLYGMHREAEADYAAAEAINPYSRVYLSADLRNKMLSKQDYSYMSEVSSDLPFAKDIKLTEQYRLLLDSSRLVTARDTLIELALLAVVDQNYDEARVILNGLVAAPDCSDVVYDLKGLLLHKAGDLDSAIYYYTRAIQANEDFVIAYHNRAVAYSQQGRLAQAEQDFYAALAINGNIANLYFGLARIYDQRQQTDRAVDFYELASDIDSTQFREARLNHAALLQSLGSYTEALLTIDEIIAADPDHVTAYFVRAGMHTIYGEYDKAIDDLRHYLGAYPQDAKPHHNLGFNYVMSSRIVAACDSFDTAASLGSVPAQDVLVLLCK